MKILIINPNTSTHMTSLIEKSAKEVASIGTEILVTNPKSGPKAIESFFDETTSTINIVKEILHNLKEKVDAVVIACFDDPGLYIFREMLEIPVIGIGESSILMALTLGWKFSILVASEKAIPLMENMVYRYGLEKRMASIETMGLSVVEIDQMGDKAIEPLLKVAEKAKSKHAEVLILGCAGLAGLDKKLYEFIKMPVIDPVKAGVKMAESIVAMKLKTSKIGIFSPLIHSQINSLK